ENRLDALLLQPIDDVGGHAGIDGSLDRGGIALIDEHRDRPAHRAADLEHLFQNVAAGVFQVDQDDVGIEGVDPRQQALHLEDVEDAGKTRLPQALLEDRGTDRAFVDNDDFRRLFGAHRSLTTRHGIHTTPSDIAKPCNYEQLGLADDHQSGRFNRCNRPPRRKSALFRSGVRRRWWIPSASSRGCGRKAMSSRASMMAPTSSSSIPAASSTAPSRNRWGRSARPWPRTARSSSPAAWALSRK